MKNEMMLVWGWYRNSDMLKRETFTDRAACWARVQALMLETSAPYTGAAKRHICHLEVYTTRPDGKREVTSFARYEAGSKFCKWGTWGSSKALLSGHPCG